MCFLFESQKLLIAGDTLFQGSIGRTDLWGGDFKKIEKSIQEKLYTLDEETSVITGHGESTSIGHEMRANSFCSSLKRPSSSSICASRSKPLEDFQRN